MKHLLAALAVLFFLAAPAVADDVFLRDDFADLSRWMPYTFKRIEQHSTYSTKRIEGGYALHAASNASASGLTFTRTWEVAKYPMLRFRWKVDNVYDKGDTASKAGDDYPLRVYVIFSWDGEAVTLGDRVHLALATLVAGDNPPHSSLNYIWANRAHEKDFRPSAYTDRSMMFILREGGEHVGQWVMEERDVAEDYRRAFGREPPRAATLAIMNDSDNTGESSTSWLDFIEIYAAGR